MHGVVLVLALWFLFAASHVGLALAPIRNPLARRLGPRGFFLAYSVVAWVTFALLVAGYASVCSEGPPGIGLARVAWARPILIAAIVAGFVLMAGSAAPSVYWDSPSAVLVQGVRPAAGLERVTRHPFFAGLTLLMGAHALLATHLTGTLFFSGFVAQSVFGAMHQARKLRVRHGAEFARYLESTSAVPFVAILRGKQRLSLGELPWLALALGAGVSFLVRRSHAGILSFYGAPVISAVIGTTALIAVISLWRARSREKPRAEC